MGAFGLSTSQSKSRLYVSQDAQAWQMPRRSRQRPTIGSWHSAERRLATFAFDICQSWLSTRLNGCMNSSNCSFESRMSMKSSFAREW